MCAPHLPPPVPPPQNFVEWFLVAHDDRESRLYEEARIRYLDAMTYCRQMEEEIAMNRRLREEADARSQTLHVTIRQALNEARTRAPDEDSLRRLDEIENEIGNN